MRMPAFFLASGGSLLAGAWRGSRRDCRAMNLRSMHYLNIWIRSLDSSGATLAMLAYVVANHSQASFDSQRKLPMATSLLVLCCIFVLWGHAPSSWGAMRPASMANGWEVRTTFALAISAWLAGCLSPRSYWRNRVLSLCVCVCGRSVWYVSQLGLCGGPRNAPHGTRESAVSTMPSLMLHRGRPKSFVRPLCGQSLLIRAAFLVSFPLAPVLASMLPMRL